MQYSGEIIIAARATNADVFNSRFVPHASDYPLLSVVIEAPRGTKTMSTLSTKRNTAVYGITSICPALAPPVASKPRNVSDFISYAAQSLFYDAAREA